VARGGTLGPHPRHCRRDRRFYRSRTDTEATLARFGARLRHEADLDTLVAELDRVVHDALQPAQISVWLRNEGSFLRNDLETLAL